MALPNGVQPNVGYGASPHVVININPSQPPVVTEQPTPRMLEAQQPRASRSYLGRMVSKITQSKKYQELAALTKKAFKPLNEYAIDLNEYAIDLGGALKIMAKETWKGVSYGALSGLAAGAVATYVCPPLVGPAFTACITAGVVAGGIIGYLSGAAKASDHFEAARQARRDEANVVNHQQQMEREANARQFETQYV